ncbi:MAG: hypothetical protein A2249_02675 [Candidatus Jacksonbacteria bacterium RIFOXYA2_FULL_44_7]|uniref:Uncharacterized protein n=1 Tax=Candidatus Jacksonbacteria bacterium RIFCSPLOWO2_02_FULL_44_20 TaxID=1798460 RepID=A0A1G2A961_9BACT|nr:MAG: hypothetical protein UW39_C0005G0057 [Parcubacteria group bacterium GW2011_GWC2_44_17]OGY72225.1 MAG: hypothetical protein A3E05_02965 [Candidatus Jacksonbacteria bacterium RIFCSPHIGHO2_12_FULL_44_12]OGY72590.1 MAG: hypothetical protein A3H61_01105 [Candidatus Jacksonbacteria bacterium RIFCSPLOWO2_02_FULL_44_20]OGY73882.1 MAG: hypothetical protein A3H07_00780 [Candidatus Jacksonbacteria bacterium RIFCSPLOWO2_12_FULL_44_15b]OGY76570.1 MAG: hypothetical protein A2249_02675 [Candidatus Jac
MPSNPLTTNEEAQRASEELKSRGLIQKEMPAKDVVREFVQESERQQEQAKTAQFETALHETPSASYGSLPQSAGGAVPSQPISAPKSEFLLAVENTLAAGVGDMYARMEPSLREVFKQKGEDVARKIEMAIASGKARFKQILAWIKEWLRMIPGVNKFFLEQEAKIKADKIFAMTTIA